MNTAVMHFPAEHPFMRRCFDEAKRAGHNVAWGDIGPRLFTRLLHDMNAMPDPAASSTCYPVDPSRALALLKPSMREFCVVSTAGSWLLHLWNSCLTNNGIDKWMRPPQGSFLRNLFDQYGIGDWTGEYVCPVTLRYDTLR